MMRRIFLPFILVLVLLVSCTIQETPSNGQTPEFKITPAKQEDIVTVANENNATVFDIQSVSGIGSASIELVSGTMPETVMVRLHTTGLEEFRLSYNETTIAASIPSGEGFGNPNERLLSPDGESPITILHPLWMKIEIVSNQSVQKIPLEEGYFEITLPKELTKDSGGAFEISWIDFFR